MRIEPDKPGIGRFPGAEINIPVKYNFSEPVLSYGHYRIFMLVFHYELRTRVCGRTSSSAGYSESIQCAVSDIKTYEDFFPFKG